MTNSRLRPSARIRRPFSTRIRSAIALSAVAALTLTAAPAAASAADSGIARHGLIAEYLFTQTTGTLVDNTADSAVGDATVVNGTDAHWTGESLVLSGGAKTSSADWVRLPDGILAGSDSATITVETKFDASMSSAWHFLWNIGGEGTSAYYFASLKDTPRTAITTSGNGGEVNARAQAPLVPDRWYSVTSVIDGEAGTIGFYIDGVLVGSGSTTLTPGDIADQTVGAIGRSPYPDGFYQGEVASFRVYDRALSATEIEDIAHADAQPHSDSFQQEAQDAVDALSALEIDDAVTVLPGSNLAAITWTSDSDTLVISADGSAVSAAQPAAGEAPVEATLTATATVRGQAATREVPVTIRPAAGADDDYGYLMVHFIEDSAGYAEKIYLDVSRGDDPEKWDPLNSGKPILASQLGTTGIRDPFLTRNPETGTYYIIATDLRVFGGDQGTGSCTSWCHWTTNGSTQLIVWESDDLIDWGEPRSFDTALDATGAQIAELGMAWAPEALWVDDYNADGSGAFVVYWSSNVYEDAAHTSASHNRVVWGATTDFTQETYAFGGDFVNTGANTIDTTMIQHDGTTYRITKDNGQGNGIYMESTQAERWWEPETNWTLLQTRIGATWAGGNAGGVEGPAVFKSHSDEKWYLYVDVIPTTGYRPMSTTDLDAGWTPLTDPSFSMAPHTKHGGIVSLTKAEYDRVRAADAVGLTTADVGAVSVDAGASTDALLAVLPAEAEVELAYGRGAAVQPVEWDTASVDLSVAGEYDVTGVVRTLGANYDSWTGAGGATAWNAPDRVLARSGALTVTARVVVEAADAAITASVSTRCVAGKAVLVTSITNTGDIDAAVSLETVFGTVDAGSIEPDRTVSRTTTTRLASIDAAAVTVTDGTGIAVTADYAARSCVR